LRVLVRDGQRETTEDSPAVHEYGTRAALTVIAALLGTRQIKMLAERIQQADPWLELERPIDTVDMQGHGRCLTHRS
jgi:hypothetical protein